MKQTITLPPLPKPPLIRLIREGTIGTCPKCHSTEKKTFWLRRIRGCIQPECENYYLKLHGLTAEWPRK